MHTNSLGTQERDSYERQLRLFEGIVSTTPDFVYVFDLQGRFQFANRRLLEVWGMNLDEIIGKTCRELGYEQWHHDMHMREIAQVIETGKPIKGEVPFKAALTGIYGVYEYIFTPVFGPNGQIEAIAGTTRDVTDRKQAEQASAEARRRMNSALIAGEVGTFEWDVPNDRLRGDANFTRMFGIMMDETGSAPISQYLAAIHPDDRSSVMQQVQDSIKTGTPYQAEYRIVSNDEERWVIARGNVEQDLEGTALRFPGVILDVTRRKLAETALNEQYRLVHTITHNATIAIFMMDATGRITFMNPSAETMTGFALSELEGRVLHECIHHTRPDGRPYPIEECPLMMAATKGQRLSDHEDEFVRRDGSHFPVRCSASPTYKNDVLAGIVLEVQDLTEQKRAEQELVAAKAAAERANQAKDDFLAVLSHELRTPLTPVLTAAGLLLEEARDDDENREVLEMIRRNIELEARLIDDLLDVTRISRGKVELNLETVNVHEKLREVYAMCADDARAKALELRFALDGEETHVRGDSARLQQVFWNLLKNAIKFTPAGGTVTVRTKKTEAGEIVIAVEDTGVGIRTDALSAIFNPFEQGGREVTRSFGGLGLGLAICKGLVDLHGGSISATSGGHNAGAVFTVTLPTVPLEGLEARHTEKGDETFQRTQKVLVVEDHPDSATLMAKALRRLSCEVHLTHTVADALSATRSEKFDLLISDIGLPDGSGLDLIKQLGSERPRRCLALSGYGAETDVRRSIDAGFDAHLVKPVSLQMLRAEVQRLLATE